MNNLYNLKFIAYNGAEESNDTISDKIMSRYGNHACTAQTTFGDFLNCYFSGDTYISLLKNYFAGDVMCSYDDGNEKKYVTFAPGYGTTDWPCECYNNRLSMVCKYYPVADNIPYLFVDDANVDNYDYLKYIDRISLSHDSLIMNVNYENGQRSLKDVIDSPQFFGNDYTAEISFHYSCEDNGTGATGDYKYTNTIDSPFTEIPEKMFYGNGRLKQISIPKTVTDIGASAFTDCDILEYFGPKRNISGYGEYCFANCTALTELDFWEYTGNTIYIGEGSFSGCSSLNKISYDNLSGNPISLYVGNSAFTNCVGLTTVDLRYIKPNRNSNSSGDSLFANCTNLTDFSSIRATEIPSKCFIGCTGLPSNTSVQYTIKADYIGSYAFSGSLVNAKNVWIETNSASFESFFLYGANLDNNCQLTIRDYTDGKIKYLNENMFSNDKIGTISIRSNSGNYNFSKITLGNNIFSGCSSLSEIDMSYLRNVTSSGYARDNVVVSADTFSGIRSSGLTVNFNNASTAQYVYDAWNAFSPKNWGVSYTASTSKIEIQ